MEIRNIRKKLKMSQREFSEYFEIPIANLQHWEQGVSSPPRYVVRMIERIVLLEFGKGVDVDA